MSWFYADNGKQIGPIDDEKWATLVSSGVVTPETLVWQNGMADWVPLSTLPAASAGARPIATAPAATTAASAVTAPAAAAPGTGGVECSECHRTFPNSEVVTIGHRPVCAACKPIAVQKLSEGVLPSGDRKFAGFWIRAGAKIIDGIILYAIAQGLNLLIGLATGTGVEPDAALMMVVGVTGANILIAIVYQSWFLGRFSATPGKMACGLKVIRPDGGNVTYLRGAGRYLAEIVSSMIFCIGYIMAAFDDEKRALHDRICDTRVVRK